jgi:cytochrome c-type biogenesis protein CcmH
LEDDVDRLEEDKAVSAEARLGWLLLPVAALAALLYLQLGAVEDVRLSAAIQSFDPDAGEAQVHELMAAVATRAAQRPDNLHYQAMLGRYYMGGEDYERARQSYLKLVEANPADASALASAAQASFLASGRVLDQEAQMLAERALNQNPHERSALGLLGMVAFERQQYRAAIGYWRRLLAVEEPGSQGAELIAGVIARAEQAIVDNGDVRVAQDLPSEPANSGAHITVRVELPQNANVRPADTVFVFARNAASESRMPVAAKRFTASQLPLEVRLDDAASMAGQKLSVLGQVMVVARISRNGQPGEANASWQGQLGPLTPNAEGPVRQLLLQAK